MNREIASDDRSGGKHAALEPRANLKVLYGKRKYGSGEITEKPIHNSAQTQSSVSILTMQ